MTSQLEKAAQTVQRWAQDSNTQKVLGLIGAAYVSKLCFESLRFGYKVFVRKQYDLAKRYGVGSWALVTGATTIFGEAFARELANQGFNICLLGSKGPKMNDIKASIKKEFPNTQVKVVERNFENCIKEGFFEELFAELKGLDISILVNNELFPSNLDVVKSPAKLLLSHSIQSLVPTTMLTQRLLLHMLARENKAAIINISSIATIQPSLYSAAFGANMIYNDYLVRGLKYFYGFKVDLLSVRADEAYTNSTPEVVVRACLKDLGKENITYGHWKNWMHALVTP